MDAESDHEDRTFIEMKTCDSSHEDQDSMLEKDDPHSNYHISENEKATLLSLSKSSPVHENSPSYKTFDDDDRDVDITSDNVPCTEACKISPNLCKKNKPHVSLQIDIKAATKHNQRQFGLFGKQFNVVQTPGNTTATEASKPLKVAVFLKEGEGHLLQLEKGKLTSAGQMKSMMMEILSIPKSASNIFSIWLVSPHLEIQLKSHHVPYFLRKQWRDMLIEFSSCQDQLAANNDEPVLVFQRNSFCSVQEEEMVRDCLKNKIYGGEY